MGHQKSILCFLLLSVLLFGLASAQTPQSFLSQVSQSGFSAFASYLVSEQLLSTVEAQLAQGEVTVFAPRDSWLTTNADQSFLQYLQNTPTDFQQVLLYHIVPFQNAKQLVPGTVFVTMATGQTLTITGNAVSGFLVQQVPVTDLARISADQGVLHGIDGLLVPPNVLQNACQAIKFCSAVKNSTAPPPPQFNSSTPPPLFGAPPVPVPTSGGPLPPPSLAPVPSPSLESPALSPSLVLSPSPSPGPVSTPAPGPGWSSEPGPAPSLSFAPEPSEMLNPVPAPAPAPIREVPNFFLPPTPLPLPPRTAPAPAPEPPMAFPSPPPPPPAASPAPPGSAANAKDLLEKLESRNYTTCISYLNSTGVSDALPSISNYTVLCPTDTAFTTFVQSNGGNLQPDTVRSLLLYHVLVGTYSSEDILAAAPNETFPLLIRTQFNSQPLSVFVVGKGIFFGSNSLVGSQVVDPDILVAPGQIAVHGVNSVVVPKNLVFDSAAGPGTPPLMSPGAGSRVQWSKSSVLLSVLLPIVLRCFR